MAPETSLLNGLRVLDLADEKGVICGRILSDLGADVIKIEPPGGDPFRRSGPYWQGQPHSERSLAWFAFNAGKRSITLALETPDGRAILRDLARTAHFLIESFPLNHLDDLGLGYDSLRSINQGLIFVSVSDFGRTGPLAGCEGSDLVDLAMGGLMYTLGDTDRPPVGFACPQAYLHAGAEAAAGAMLAHHYRQRTGMGQSVDVSAQEAVTWTLMHTAQFWDMQRVNIGRGGAIRNRPDGPAYRMHWPCRDGFVTFVGRMDWSGLSRWMIDEGYSDDPILLTDWSQVGTTTLQDKELERLRGLAEPFFARRTMEELYMGAIKWRFNLYPVYTVADLLQYSQLKERNFFTDVQHDELGASITYPGTFVRTNEAQPTIQGRAPLIGEHNVQVYCGELGLSTADLTVLAANGAI